MQNCNSYIKEIVENLENKQKLDENKTPTLNNVYDCLLEKYPKLKEHSIKIREIIIKNLKIQRELHYDNTSLIINILRDIVYFFTC